MKNEKVWIPGLAALLFVAACGPVENKPSETPSATVSTAVSAEDAAADAALLGDAEAGKAIYDKSCIACHQADGKGMGGALGADFVNDKTRSAKSNAQLLASIEHGIKGTTMVSWAPLLSETERKDVLAYIRKAFMEE